MATNPNDIAKVLNEMMSTLQDLSKKELESVENIIQEKKKILENEKKIKDAQKELNRIKKETEKTEKSIEKEKQKTLINKKLLLSSLIVSGKKISKVSISPKDLITKISIKTLERKNISSTGTLKRSQSLLDYQRKSEGDDIQIEQLKVLKEIDKKVSDLSMAGSGGLFDFLKNGLGEFVSKTVANALGIGSGAAGGLLGGLGGKVAKSIPKALGKAGKVLKYAKNPIVAGGLLTGIAGLGAYKLMSQDSEEVGAYKLMSQDSEEVEPRQFGGNTKVGKTYLVGEDGPELFTPKNNGMIIPNHKLKSPEVKKNIGFTDNLISILQDFRKGFQKNLGNLISKFNFSFKDFGLKIGERLSNIYNGIKDWVSEYSGKAKEVLSNATNKAKSAVSDIFDNIKKLISPKKEVKEVSKSDFKFPTSPFDVMSKYKVPEVNVPKSDIVIENEFSIRQVPNDGVKNELDKKFWTDIFVPAFANSLKVRKDSVKNRTANLSDVFG